MEWNYIEELDRWVYTKKIDSKIYYEYIINKFCYIERDVNKIYSYYTLIQVKIDKSRIGEIERYFLDTTGNMHTFINADCRFKSVKDAKNMIKYLLFT